MRSRWFHPPTLHGAHLPHKAAGWLELFYDLIFVAAFIQLGNGLSDKVSLASAAAFAGSFTALWISWSGFTYFMNRFTIDDFVHRLMVFAQMSTVAVMAFYAGELLAGRHRGFALAYAASQFLVAGFNLRAALQVPSGRRWSRYWGTVFALAGVVWLMAAFTPEPWAFAVMALGALVIFFAPLSSTHRSFNESHPIDEHHLAERLGLLTLIVLGESFVKVLDAASSSSDGQTLLMRAAFLLVLTISIWWVYFDDVAGSRLRRGRLHDLVWWLGHLPLQMGVTATGVAIKKASGVPPDVVMKGEYRWLLCGSLAVVLGSTAAIDSVTERKEAELSDRARVGMRAFSTLAVLLLAVPGGSVSAQTFLVLLTALLVSQVVFDMMMAPLQETPEELIDAQPLRERARRPASERTPQPEDPTTTVRRRTPGDLRHDLYFFLMDGGWTRVLAVFAFGYLVSNLLFASLFTLRPDSILSAVGKPVGFAEAFYFSVQTMSTIGYGVLSPGTPYGDTLVTIEAAFGLFGVALATGFVFAKVSRPSSRILFSEPLLLTQRDGAPYLMFRAGNVRGNELIEASVSVVALFEAFTEEGEHHRRMVDVEVERSNSPLFALTWTVLHRITEESPFRELHETGSCDDLVAVTATITALDGTYGQTVHSRKSWAAGQIQSGRRFVDVLSQLPDGRLMVDYGRFHRTEPFEASS